MQPHFARRIANLEESLLPLSASVFFARAKAHARRTRTTFWSAFDSLLSKVSDDEIEQLTGEFERMAFGDDTAARDAAKRQVLAAAGYQVWNLPGEELMEDGW